MKHIDLNISPQNFYFIFITIFVAGFFGVLIFLSTGLGESRTNLSSPSPVDFAKVLGADTKKSEKQNPSPNLPAYLVGPNPNERYKPTPTPLPTSIPASTIEKTNTPTPSPTQTPSPEPTQSPTPSPIQTPTSTPSASPTLTPTPNPT